MGHDLFKPVPIAVPIVGGTKGKYIKNENGLPVLQPDYVTTGGLQRILNEFAFKIQMAMVEQVKQRIPMGILILDGDEPTIEFWYKGGVKNKILYRSEALDNSSPKKIVSRFALWGKSIQTSDESGDLLAFEEGNADIKISEEATTTTPFKGFERDDSPV